jgi:hypothetical protein
MNQSTPPIVTDRGSLDCSAQPCDAAARGQVAFNDRNLRHLGGNGRACADCHVPSEAFQPSPAVARARLERRVESPTRNKYAVDPLFRPVDADDLCPLMASSSIAVS